MDKITYRKTADYAILENNHYKDWFLDHNSKGGAVYISYGQFLIHALWKKSKLDANTYHPILDELELLCEQEIDLKKINNFNILKITYCKDCHNNIEGILIRDKSKGCYPLYINNHDRHKGFLQHIQHIKKNWAFIVNELKPIKIWNAELERNLDPYYFDIQH